MPASVANAIREARSEADVIAAFKDNVTDPVDRAVLYLQLFACSEGPWPS